MVELLAAAVCGILVSEIAFHIQWAEQISVVRRSLEKALRLLASNRISDHYKERLVPLYSMRSLVASVRLGSYFVLAGAPIIAAVVVTFLDIWSGEDMFAPMGAVVMFVASGLYLAARLSFRRRRNG